MLCWLVFACVCMCVVSVSVLVLGLLAIIFFPPSSFALACFDRFVRSPEATSRSAVKEQISDRVFVYCFCWRKDNPSSRLHLQFISSVRTRHSSHTPYNQTPGFLSSLLDRCQNISPNDDSSFELIAIQPPLFY